MITFAWQITPEDVWPGIVARQVAALERDLVKLIDSMVEEVTAWLRANAPWQDVTGNARAGLHAELVHLAGTFAGLMLSHGDDLPYTYWLEVAHRGKYSIIAPALDFWSPKLKQEVIKLVRQYSS